MLPPDKTIHMIIHKNQFTSANMQHHMEVAINNSALLVQYYNVGRNKQATDWSPLIEVMRSSLYMYKREREREEGEGISI